MKFGKIIKIVLLVLFLCIFSTIPAKSQVTIGSLIEPLKGTLLDLKESEEENGNENSEGGLILPRVFLTNMSSLSPMLTGAELADASLKPKYTGLIVYNVNTSSSFEKGLYVWDGTKWNILNSIPVDDVTALNGIHLSGKNFELGGDLIENTTINQTTYNLIFDKDDGRIGIGTSTPKASVHIENPNSIEPLILNNLLSVSDPKNAIDDANPAYYDLRVSDNGVVRKVIPLDVLSGAPPINLSTNTTSPIASGNSSGSGGTWLVWQINSSPQEYVELPEDGVYFFSFNFFGSVTINTPADYADSNSYFLSAFKNGKDPGDLVEIQEFILFRVNGFDFASYSINLAVAGYANEKIYFKLAYDNSSTPFRWYLSSGNDNTCMIFWKQ